MAHVITKHCPTCEHGVIVPRDRVTCPRCGADLLHKAPERKAEKSEEATWGGYPLTWGDEG